MEKIASYGREEREEGYRKTLLYIYPHLPSIAKALSDSLQTKALLSYRYTCSTEKLAEELIIRRIEKEILIDTAKKIGEIISGFGEEELFLLELRYFRRKRELKKYSNTTFPYSLRTFYRRQHALLKKFGAELARRGMDEKWFIENFSSMQWAMTVYKKVLAGKEAFLLGKRKEGLRARDERMKERQVS